MRDTFVGLLGNICALETSGRNSQRMIEQANVDLSSSFVLLLSEEQLAVGKRSCSSPTTGRIEWFLNSRISTIKQKIVMP